jgi:hypothetical protein
LAPEAEHPRLNLASISCVDTAGGANQGSGASGGLYFWVWRTLLWYHGRSMVVPYCYQCSPGAQPAILTIANAYATQPARGHSCPGQGSAVSADRAPSPLRALPYQSTLVFPGASSIDMALLSELSRCSIPPKTAKSHFVTGAVRWNAKQLDKSLSADDNDLLPFL